ncbi:glycosyltransferase family 39 protein [Candidatus Altiarchaeota archaeon]
MRKQSLIHRLMENDFIILSMIMMIGLLLRVHALGVQSLAQDELSTIHKSQMPFGEIIYGAINIPGLYFLIIKAICNVFGYSELSLRLPSVILSVALTPLLYVLGRQLYDRRTGLASGFLIAVSNYNILHSRNARMYPLFWFLMIASFIFLIKSVRRNGKWDWMLYSVSSAMMFYTHYHAAIIFFIQFVGLLLTGRNRLKQWGMSFIVICLLYLPQATTIYESFVYRTGIHWIFQNNDYLDILKIALSRITTGDISGDFGWDLMIYLALLILGLNACVKSKQHDKLGLILPLGWIIIPILGFWIVNNTYSPMLTMGTIRYIGFLHIPLILLIGKGLSTLEGRVLLIACMILLVSSLGRSIPQYTSTRNLLYGEDWKTFAGKLTQSIDGKTVIVTDMPKTFFSYYFPRQEIMNINEFKKDYKSLNLDSFILLKNMGDTTRVKKVEKEFKGFKFKSKYCITRSCYYKFNKK